MSISFKYTYCLHLSPLMSLLHVDKSYTVISNLLEYFLPYSTLVTMTNQSCSIKCILLGNNRGEFDAMLVTCCISGQKSYIWSLGVEEKTTVCKLVADLSLIYWQFWKKKICILFIFFYSRYQHECLLFQQKPCGKLKSLDKAFNCHAHANCNKEY